MTEPVSPEDAAVLREARSLLQQNRPAEAARIVRLRLQRHTGTAAEYMLLGVALCESGEGLMAVETLEQAVAMEPENAAAHYNLGEAYHTLGRDQEARAEWVRALQLRPDYPAVTRALAELRRPPAAPASAPPAARPDPEVALALLQADELMRRERAKPPGVIIGVLAIFALALIGLLLAPYLPAAVGLAVYVLVPIVVAPLILWCLFWLQIQSLRRKEDEALRRGDTFDADVAKADRKMYEWLWRWW